MQTILVHAREPVPISPALASRLSRRSRDDEQADLAEQLSESAERHARLRLVHQEAIKDRAQRDLQRVQEAAARRRRVASAHVEQCVSAISNPHDNRIYLTQR